MIMTSKMCLLLCCKVDLYFYILKKGRNRKLFLKVKHKLSSKMFCLWVNEHFILSVGKSRCCTAAIKEGDGETTWLYWKLVLVYPSYVFLSKYLWIKNTNFIWVSQTKSDINLIYFSYFYEKFGKIYYLFK